VAIARITGQGLAAISVVVCLLWACILAERLITARANADTAHTVRELKRLRGFAPVLRSVPHTADEGARATL
jgi:hypothetical protein